MTATGVVGSNKLPVIVTEVSTGPEIGLSVMVGVTVNAFEAVLDPWVATTDLAPWDDWSGTVKVAENAPLLSGVTGFGVVVTGVPPKVMVTVELGSNPAPVISTGVPTGPESGLRKIKGSAKP